MKGIAGLPDMTSAVKGFVDLIGLSCSHGSRTRRSTGGTVGRVGVPHYAGVSALEPTFYKNITISGGPAPVRAYIAELLPDVLEGRIQPGRVFDRVVGIGEVPDGYRTMDKREVIKVMVKP